MQVTPFAWINAKISTKDKFENYGFFAQYYPGMYCKSTIRVKSPDFRWSLQFCSPLAKSPDFQHILLISPAIRTISIENLFKSSYYLSLADISLNIWSKLPYMTS